MTDESISTDVNQQKAKEYVGRLQQLVTGSVELDEEEQAIVERQQKLAAALRELEKLIQESEKERKSEKAAFLGLDNMDDVFARVPKMVTENPKLVAADLYRRMLEVYQAVERRRTELYKQLDNIKVDVRYLAQNDAKTCERAKTLAAGIRGDDGPLPSDFEPQREKLAKRLATLAATPEEKLQALRQVEEERLKNQEDERKNFKAVLEKSGMRDIERMKSFDPFVVAADRDDEKLLLKQFEAARDRYLKVLDSGGTLAEAETHLSHIPKCWWPPAFVKEVQAWRVIERQRQAAAVKKMFEEAQGEKGKKEESEEGSTVKTLDSAVGALATITSTGASKSKYLELFHVAPEKAEEVGKILQSISTAFSTLQTATPGVDFLMEFDEFREKNKEDKVEAVATAVGEFGEKIDTALGAAKLISEAAKEAVENFIGPVVLGTGIAKFLQGCLQMKKLGSSMKNTANLIDRAEIEMVLGDREDGGALVRSMENSRSNQKVKLVQTAVETGLAAMQIAEGATETAGHAPAAYVIKTARKVIALGAKVAFAEVDFRKARQAMRTLNDARAGSMVAQQQIFEDSTYYAMSYIAFLVEQDDPIALSFARRSYTDADLKHEEVSTSILVELMQKAAGTFQDDEGSETRTEALGKAVKSGYDAVKEKWDGFRDKYFPSELPGSVGTEYDAKWKHKAEDVVLSEGAWMGARKRAIDEAGLVDDDVKMPVGVRSAAAAFDRLGLQDAGQFTANGLKDAAKEAAPTSPFRNKATMLQACKELDTCRAAIEGYDAGHTPSGTQQTVGPHAGFVAYQVELVREANRCLAFLESKLDEPDWLTGSAPRDFSWTPPKKVLLESPDFRKHWETAARQAWLPEDPPGGVISALNEVSGAKLATKGREKELSAAARDQNKYYFDQLVGLTKEVDKAWPACLHPGLKDYLLAVKLEAAKIARELDTTLCELPSFRVKNAAFESKAWKATYDDARERGAADKIDDLAGTLRSNLATWEDADSKIKSQKPSDKIVGRTDGLLALKEVNKAAIAAGDKIGSPPMVDHCVLLASTAKQKLQDLDRENNQVTFAWQGKQIADPGIWASVYQDAVNAGAVVEKKSLSAAVGKSLTELKTRNEALFKATEPKARREAATELVKAISKADEAARALQDDKGHRNANFQAMLAELLDRIAAQRQSGLLENVLSGARGGEFKPPAPSGFNRLAWDGTDGAQHLAVKVGILANADDDSFALAIGEVYTQDNLWGLQSREAIRLPSSMSPKELIETKRKLREALEALKKAAQKQIQSVDHAGYQKYMEGWIKLADERVKKIAENKETQNIGEFNPGPFVYGNEAWQKAKEQAVGMGILEDVRTNVGKFLDSSKEKHEAYVKLRDQGSSVTAEALETARQEAMSQIRQAMSAVAKTRKLALKKNDTWEKYLDQAVQAIQTRYDDCVRTTSAFVAFDVKLPRDPTRLDWQRAQELAVKAGLLTDSRDETFALEIGDAQTKCSLFFEMCTAIGIEASSARKARDEALDSLRQLDTGAKRERSKSPDKDYQGYLDAWSEYGNRRTELVNKRYAANFE